VLDEFNEYDDMAYHNALHDRGVSLIINARVKSTRIKNKLLRPFSNDGKCLLEIALDRLASIEGQQTYLAAVDDEIIDLYESRYSESIELLERDAESVVPGILPYNVSFKHYNKVTTPYVMPINPCFPFAQSSTYIDAIRYFNDNPQFKTTTSLKRSRNLFFDMNMNMVNGKSEVINTQGDRFVYEMAHMFHIFHVDSFMETGEFWDYSEGNPSYYIVDNDIECIDIDEPLDFIMAQQLYNFCEGDIDRITLNET